MKSSLILGFAFAIIGAVLFFITYGEDMQLLDFFCGLLLGAGAGLILGNLFGYQGRSKMLKKKKTEEEEKINL